MIKAVGLDQIPNWVLKDVSSCLAGPLSANFNSSLREGFIPPIWKCAHVATPPKVTPAQIVDKDLRSISLTPVISKTMESFVHPWIWNIMKEKIDKGQFGAIKGSCTTFVLIQMIDQCLSATDDSRMNCVHIVWFDHVNANILLSKLAELYIPDFLLRWVQNFLIGHQQRVKIGHNFSDWLEIWGTVPQGTLLGVLCFICMINDLFTGCETIKNVDDRTLYNVSSQTDDQALQEALNVTTKWSTENDLRFNGAKTSEMLIRF